MKLDWSFSLSVSVCADFGRTLEVMLLLLLLLLLLLQGACTPRGVRGSLAPARVIYVLFAIFARYLRQTSVEAWLRDPLWIPAVCGRLGFFLQGH